EPEELSRRADPEVGVGRPRILPDETRHAVRPDGSERVLVARVVSEIGHDRDPAGFPGQGFDDKAFLMAPRPDLDAAVEGRQLAARVPGSIPEALDAESPHDGEVGGAFTPPMNGHAVRLSLDERPPAALGQPGLGLAEEASSDLRDGSDLTGPVALKPLGA